MSRRDLEASSFRVGVCVCKHKCTYVCERESRTLFACPCDGFQPCLIMFAFKLSFMLFATSFATSRESYAFIEVSLMFSCCLFASDAMLVKRHIFFLCIKVYCCSTIEDHQCSAQVTVGFRADFVLLNNMLSNVSKQGALAALNIKTIFQTFCLWETKHDP